MHYKNGFTLLELTIVISLISIITVSILPNFLGFSKRQSVLQLAEKLKTDFETSQNKALTGVVEPIGGERVDWGINFTETCKSSSLGVSEYYLGYFDSNEDFVPTNTQVFTGFKLRCDTGQYLLRFQRLTGNVVDWSSNIVFYLGLLSETNFSKQLILGPTGQVAIEDISNE